MTAKTPASSTRTRVERGIYVRHDKQGRKVYVVGYRDSDGRQRWQTVAGGITAARTARDTLTSARGRGEQVRPNPRLRFGDAADRWLAEQVSELRPRTIRIYTTAVETHLRPCWGNRRMDAITTADCARLVRELRAQGKAEWTIAGVLKAASRVFAYAARQLDWHGTNPVAGMARGERPRTGQAPARRIFQGTELAETLTAAHEPYRTLFHLAAVTGARESELLGLVWGDVDLADPEQAAVTFSFQLDLDGGRVELKTEESQRTVELPRSLARVLLEHRARSPRSGATAFVFATRTGRAISQRNTLRELRRAMTAARTRTARRHSPRYSSATSTASCAWMRPAGTCRRAEWRAGRSRPSTASDTPPRRSRSPMATSKRSAGSSATSPAW